MSRYVDIERLVPMQVENSEVELGILVYDYDAVQYEPFIDICFCYECKWEWTQKCPPHRMGLIHDASDYCSYGIRKTDDE